MRVNRMRNLLVLMACLLAVILMGCGGGGGSAADPDPVTIHVSTNQDGAGFTIAAEGGTYSGSGQTYSRDVPAGAVTVSFHNLDGYCTPAAMTLTGSAGDILNFEGVYTQGCNCTIVINTNLDEARYVIYGPQEVYSGFGKTKEFRVPEGDYIVRFSEVDDACYQRPATKLFQMRGGEVWEPQFTYETTPDCTSATTYYKDEDGDLYSDGTTSDATNGQPEGYYLPSELIATRGDCDDADPLENPNETGMYCGADTETTWYYDADADQYGDANNYIEADSQPMGYVDNANDCDDADDSIHPGATEIRCDSIDQDCNPSNDCPSEDCSNGIDDDGDGDTDCNDSDCDAQCPDAWYRDSDGDTYGDPNDVVLQESQPAGYVANFGDCDDSDENIHVDAADSSVDGIDRNCDGYDGPVYFADAFEHGLDKWDITAAATTWGLETELVGGGENVLSDSPDILFPADNDVSATMKNSIDLTQATSPILTVWHKYAFGKDSGDSLQIEYSSDGGVTWRSQDVYNRNYHTIETYRFHSFDISDDVYKSAQAKFRFRFSSDNDANLSQGWQIDKVVIRESDAVATLSLPFSEGFESGLTNWEVSGLDWQVTASDAHSGSNAITDSDGAMYGGNAFATLVSKGHFNLMTTTTPQLSFWHKYDFGRDSGDLARVYISRNGGASWQSIWSENYQTITAWAQETIDLTPYRSNQFQIMFVLETDDDTNVADGWSIDDIEIVDTTP
jgi:hypothetical protein